jgi:hypothetical protein
MLSPLDIILPSQKKIEIQSEKKKKKKKKQQQNCTQKERNPKKNLEKQLKNFITYESKF